jgi:hypothetical protein
VFLDLDNTIVGNGSALLQAWQIVGSTRWPNLIDTTTVFSTVFVRPGLSNFITELKRGLQNVEVFVYSAGTREWVESVVAGVERSTGVRFNRPLFCRDDMVVASGTMCKSLAAVLPKAAAAIKDKYPSLKQRSGLHALMADRVCLVDDIPTVLLEKGKQIVSPCYQAPALIGMSKHVYKQLHSKSADRFWSNLLSQLLSHGTLSNDNLKRINMALRRVR